ncbi:MAG TPA: YihY family inner membrane protein [Rhodanobacteraceae bacterium]|nr:YihY family inner membrane protein [Rhodanobacteraceae bacterium]
MAPLTLLHQRIDRERLRAFAGFLWQRFLDDKCFETAGALSYTTLFAIVPLLTAVIAIVSAFPVFANWRDRLTDFIFSNFVPAAGSTVQSYLLQFADNASKLTALGLLFLLVSALMMMASIEDRFNRIWRVQTRRSRGSRLLLYWAALTIGPLLVIAALVLVSRFATTGPDAAQPSGLAGYLLAALPFVLTWLVLLGMYMLVPNRTVAFRHAGIAAVIAAILFQIARVLFAIYVSNVPSYQQIYGALAAAPLFLMWLYFSWVIVLLGASLAAAMAAFEYRPLHDRLPAGCEFIGLLRVLQHFAAAQREGKGLHSEDLCKRERFLADDLLQRYLGDLHAAGLLTRAEAGEWVLSRDLATADIADLYRAGRYRLPLNEAAMQHALIGLAEPARLAIVAASEALRENLAVPLAALFTARGEQ